MNYYFLDDKLYFPPLHKADSHGILAVGGDLSIERLLLAYHSGIFPWFSEDSPILWWSPNPRFVLYPKNLKVSKSMRPYFNQKKFDVTYDSEFLRVITNCQKAKREGQNGTWLHDNMLEAYTELHNLGFAHSVEVWQNEELVGGLYGVSLGNCFFGESMFSHLSNASKFGFITLVKNLEQLGFDLIDCQVHTTYLESLGAEYIPREEFIQHLNQSLTNETYQGKWRKLFE